MSVKLSCARNIANAKQILSISIYIKTGRKEKVEFSKRAVLYNGYPKLKDILQEESNGEHIKRVQNEGKKEESMLVLGKIYKALSSSMLMVYSVRYG
jgi:hypothetical protein